MTQGVQSNGRRRCATDGCRTLLSKYNPGSHCHSHDNPRDDERHTAYMFRIDKEIRDDNKRLKG